MNKELNQKISQLLDDELHHAEEEFLLNKMIQQPELKNKMHRYHTVSQVLKTDDFILIKDGFLESISQQIKHEPHHFLPKQKDAKKKSYLWQKTSAAIAASVAIVSIVIFQQTELDTATSQQQMAVVAQNNTASPDVQQVTESASQHERFKAYLQAHSDDLYKYGSVNYPPHVGVANFGQD